MKMTKNLLALVLALVMLFAVSAPAFAAETEIKIPIVLEIPQEIAGAEFALEYSDGLSFKSFEKASNIGNQTVKDDKAGTLNFNFFASSNIYAPVDGKLVAGNAVFEYTGNAPETVTCSRVKLIWCVDKDNTDSVVRNPGISVKISREADGEIKIDPEEIVVDPEGNEEWPDPEKPDPEKPDPEKPGPGKPNPGTPGGNDGTEIPDPETPLGGKKPNFDDVDGVEWAWEAITYMSENKGVLGVGDNKFNPYGNVTRAQFARFLALAFDIDMGSDNPVFTDVPSSAWFYDDVMKLASHELILGYGDGRFGPDDSITREQMAAMVMRVLDYLSITVPATREFNLTDLDQAAEYARGNIRSLYCGEIINGMGNNLFAPKGTANRAQACVIIYQALKATDKL